LKLEEVIVWRQGGALTIGETISPFQAKIELDFLDQPASGALGRDAIAIEKTDCFPVFFYRLDGAYR
jgi:hypothetical protein